MSHPFSPSPSLRGTEFRPRVTAVGTPRSSFHCASRPTVTAVLTVTRSSQGYLSFWNDNISYALRGCILIELALRRRIALVKDPNRRRLPTSERLVEVLDDRITGETILDEALKMMKAQEGPGGERMSVGSWIDLMSGTSVSNRLHRQVANPPNWHLCPFSLPFAFPQERRGIS